MKSVKFLHCEKIGALLLAAVMISCGTKSGSFYGEDGKRFGAGEEEPDDSDAIRKTSPTRGGQGPQDNGDISLPPTPPDTLLIHNNYQSKFKHATVLKLLDNTPPSEPLIGAVKDAMIAQMTISPLDGLVLKGTYGDGKSWSGGTQEIVNTAGDTKGAGVKTESGFQEYLRVSGDAAGSCPNVLVCIKHLTWQPNIGQKLKLCYSDPSAAEYTPMPFPFAAPPNYSEPDYASLDGVELGPYRVSRFTDLEVDCDNPVGFVPDAVTDVVVKIRYSTPAEITNATATQPVGALAIDFGIVMEYAKTTEAAAGSDIDKPYVDSLIKSQSKAQHFFNQEDRQMVKLIKTARTETGLPWPLPHGAQVDVDFDLCQNMLEVDATPLCFRE